MPTWLYKTPEMSPGWRDGYSVDHIQLRDGSVWMRVLQPDETPVGGMNAAHGAEPISDQLTVTTLPAIGSIGCRAHQRHAITTERHGPSPSSAFSHWAVTVSLFKPP